MKNRTLVKTQRIAGSSARIVCLIACMLLAVEGLAQKQVAKTPTNLRNITGFYEHLPGDYNVDKNKRYPLLIFCHGVDQLAGTNKTKPMSSILRFPIQAMIENGTFPASFTVNNQQFSFIVISPQFITWPGSNDVHELIEYLKKQYRIDPDRVYVTGVSMGGGVTWGVVSEVPARAKKIAAAVVICGAWDPNTNKQLARTIGTNSTPIWALHNDGDGTVPSQYSRNWVSQINAVIPTPNPKARVTIFPTNGHNAWTKAYDLNYKENGKNVYEWMLQYSLNKTPVPAGPKRIMVPPTSGRELYYPDAMNMLDANPGDTLCIPAGDYDYIAFGNIQGTADKPVIITNCGGQVRVGVNSNATASALSFGTSKYFKVEGTGAPGIEYGFDVNGTNKKGEVMYGVAIGSGTTDFDIHHVYVHDCGTFLQAKTLQQCAHPEWLEGTFVMRNVKIHHIKGRNSAWEGFYIGNTHYLWNEGNCQNMKSHHIENLQVYDNDLESIGSDGIQISMADMGTNKVYNNRVVSYGKAGNAAHGYGILVGGGSKLRVYNNKVLNGFGPAVEVFGTGINHIYNNLIVNIQEEGVNVTDVGLFDPPTAYIYNNTLINTGLNAIKIYAHTTTIGHKIYNNLMVVPGTPYDYPENGVYIKGDKPIKFDYENNLSLKDAKNAAFIAAGTDYHLTGASPAVNKGRDMSDLGLTTDMEGRVRPFGNKYDIGAYEYQGSQPNQPPVASAGGDTTITLPLDSLRLNGAGSSDPDGTISKYAWKQVSGPSAAVFRNAAIASPIVTKLKEGKYIFELKVTDSKNGTDTARVMVTVNPAPNKPPVANAGKDTAITLPVNSLQLDGTASSDPDGPVKKYSWKQVSGPAAAAFNDTAAATPVVSGLVEGRYVFELKVTDEKDATATDQVTVAVNPAPNKPPVAKAGKDTTITLPLNSIQLNGTGSSDPDGTVSKYAWKQESGPSTATFNNAASATPTVSGLLEGTYVFELTVTDDDDATATDQVIVTVNPAPNKVPVAGAGRDTTITLPVSSIQLNGTGSSDPDGTVSKYAWKQESGPSTATFNNAASATPTVSGLLQGAYVFELTITDDDDATATDQVTVTVNPAPNKVPVASAGSDTTITLPVSSIQLNGTGSSDPDGTISKYAWEQVSGPSTATFNNAASSTPTVSGLEEGTYTFELTVTDDDDATATDQLTVTVNPAPNKVPVAKAGKDTTITLPLNSIQLNGSGSSDPDGTISKYAWEQVSGPSTATFNNAASGTPTVSGLEEGTYTFELTVTDDDDATATDQLTVTVNPAPNKVPVASAGSDTTITLPVSSIQLNGTASSDADGTISKYAWEQVSGPSTATFNNAASSTPTVSGLEEGTYTFELTVTDDDDATATDQVTVTVNPAPNKVPVASAGSDTTITLPVSSIQLNGSGSSDPDGTISKYAWEQVSGPSTATFNNAASGTPTVSGLEEGTYTFELTVTDDDDATATDQVTVTVNPAPNKVPVASAGRDTTITLPISSIQLNGTGSSDPDGTISKYAWEQVSGPSTATFNNAASGTPTVSGLEEGTYTFELTVTDDDAATATDQVTVTVNPAPNKPPVANAGKDTAITLPVSSIQLNGTASSDADGTISKYAWEQVSGPATATFNNAASATPTVSNLEEGTYTFELTVTDDDDATATDRVTVTVQTAPNQLPVADAGKDTSIVLPQDNITLNGTGSYDPDGTIAKYMWSQVSGPSTALFNNAAATAPTVSELQEGQYVFELKITDNKNATATAQVTVTVKPEPNQLPVANAGGDTSITLPQDNITLNGTSSYDDDGSISKFMWSQVSGPSTALFNNAAASGPTVSELQEGQYVFELTVTDNKNATATDRVTVTVKPEPPNQLPQAIAGADTAITLPRNQITLNGTSSYDPDGTINKYMWSQVSGPSTALFNNAAAAGPSVSELQEGQYVFELTVTDNKNATASARVTVTVRPAPNQTPIAVAGADTTVTLPVAEVALNGDGSYDPDGDIRAYSWKQVSGPSTALLSNASAMAAKASKLVVGVYVFELAVTDDKKARSSGRINITVQQGSSNAPPVSATQGDVVIELPQQETAIDGTESYDPDGSVAGYRWLQLSGPGIAIIGDPYAPATKLTNMYKSGTYKFQLTVTDNQYASTTSSFTVKVQQKVPTDSLFIYPNPATTSLRLNIQMGVPANLHVVITNLLGVTKRDLQYSNVQTLKKDLDIADLPWGYYVITVTGNNGFQWSKTFMKASE